MRLSIDLAAAVAACEQPHAAVLTLRELVRAFNTRNLGDDDWRLRKWLDAFGHYSAWDITSELLENAAEAMLKAGYKPSTVNRDLSTLGTCYKWARRQRLTPRGFRSPTLGVRRYTGNNITLASDNARRTLVCDLQLKVESPRDRNQDFEVPDLSGFIKAHRPELIVAGLTVLRAYAIQQPLRMPPLESFEDWSWRVRDALIWLGQEDPVAAVQFDNDGTGEIAQAFVEIDAVVQAKRPGAAGAQFRANDLVNWAANNHVLRDALELAGCTDTNSSGKVGYWLRSLKNRVAGGLCLRCHQVRGGREVSKWSIAAAEGAQQA